ncbi:MAG: hypothetical protein QW540_04765 [Archaeoglobaceae archaeon]
MQVKQLFRTVTAILFTLVGALMLLAYFGSSVISFATSGIELAVLGVLNLMIGAGLFLKYKFAYYFALFSAILMLVSAISGEITSLLIAVVVLVAVLLSEDMKVLSEKIATRVGRSESYRFYRRT